MMQPSDAQPGDEEFDLTFLRAVTENVSLRHRTVQEGMFQAIAEDDTPPHCM